MIDAPLIRPPRPQAVRMAAWAPARMAGPVPGSRKLGAAFLGLNFDNTTLLAAAAGGGALLAAGAFDPPESTLIKVGGFVALGYAAYRLFGVGDIIAKNEKEAAGPKIVVLPQNTSGADAKIAAESEIARQKAEAAQKGETYTPGDVMAVSGEILSPVGDANSAGWLSVFGHFAEYDVKIRLTNYGSSAVTGTLEYRVAYYSKDGTSQVKSTRWMAVKIPPAVGDQAGTYEDTKQVKADYDSDHSVRAAATLYFDGRPISPTVKFVP